MIVQTTRSIQALVAPIGNKHSLVHQVGRLPSVYLIESKLVVLTNRQGFLDGVCEVLRDPVVALLTISTPRVVALDDGRERLARIAVGDVIERIAAAAGRITIGILQAVNMQRGRIRNQTR